MLMELDKFRQWMHLSIGTKEEIWFPNLVDDTKVDGLVKQFEVTCQKCKTEYFR